MLTEHGVSLGRSLLMQFVKSEVHRFKGTIALSKRGRGGTRGLNERQGGMRKVIRLLIAGRYKYIGLKLERF